MLESVFSYFSGRKPELVLYLNAQGCLIHQITQAFGAHGVMFVRNWAICSEEGLRWSRGKRWEGRACMEPSDAIVLSFLALCVDSSGGRLWAESLSIFTAAGSTVKPWF